MKFRALIAVQALVACVLVALPLSKTLQRVWMEQFHLSSDSYATWYALQPFPRMYNFENEVFYCPGVDELDASVDLDACASSYFNHYPARSITFGANARLLARQDGAALYLLRSRYRSQSFTSRCAVNPEASGGALLVSCLAGGASHE